MRITKVDDRALMILRMEFGGANGTFGWTEVITKPVTSLGKNILNSDWDETKIHSLRVEFFLVPVLLLTSTACGNALPLGAVVPFSPHGKINDFLDNIYTAGHFDKN